MDFAGILTAINTKFGDGFATVDEEAAPETVRVSSSQWGELAPFLREEDTLSFDAMMCITGIDEGAESAVFTVSGSMSLDEYREILRIFRSGQVWFKDPFEEREASAIISNLEYEGSTGEYSIEITEDVDIEW